MYQKTSFEYLAENRTHPKATAAWLFGEIENFLYEILWTKAAVTFTYIKLIRRWAAFRPVSYS